MNDFVPHVDGSAVFGQRKLDNLDGAIDPGAETTGRGEHDVEAWECG